MKINPNFSAFQISSKGMSIQKKQMDIITENIANTSTTRSDNGEVYKRKFISVEFEKEKFQGHNPFGNLNIGFKNTSPKHFSPVSLGKQAEADSVNFDLKENVDDSVGEFVYMPDHPDANEDGYVEMPNVNVVTEMVDMISASRSFEANMTAFNSAKQMAKDSLEI